MPRNINKLIDGTTITVDGDPVLIDETARSYHAIITGTGAVSATIAIDGSNDSQAIDGNIKWVSEGVGTIALSDTGEDSAGLGTQVPWLLTRARVTAISGTDASVDVIMVS